MKNFKILKKSKESNARLGLLETSHGIIETPCLIPVATQATVKTLTSKEVEETKSQALICNTFWLHLKPGENVVAKAGGLHKFMNWKRPLMTDSGGYQVFSLGFMKDLGINSKIIKKDDGIAIKEGRQPQKLKINEDGVVFQSPIDGKELFLGPKESMKIQEKLGADIIFAFDECPPPSAEKKYIQNSLERTHRWAKVCLEAKKSSQALYGIVQGSRFKDLRQVSAQFISSLEFDGFGIGGEFGTNKKEMASMLDWVMQELPERKPRHLLGVGALEDLEMVIKAGVDTFDCTIPTHYARRGIAFGSEGRLDLYKAKFLKKRESLDKNCTCDVCLNYTKDYICHLLRAKEITALRLITSHNLFYFNEYIEGLKKKVKSGSL